MKLGTPFASVFLPRLHQAVNAHDADAIAALCSEDVICEDPAAPHTLHGRESARVFHPDIMFTALPDTHVELIDGPFITQGDTGAAVRLRISGTMTGSLTPPGFAPTGAHLAFETAEFSQFKSGLLARHTVIINMLDVARQIGAVPQVGSAADRFGILLQHV